MKGVLILILVFSSLRGYTQYDMTIGYFQSFLITKPKEVSAINNSIGAIAGVGYTKVLSNKCNLQSQAQYQRNKLIMDGMFVKNNGQYSFTVTPENYKQSYLTTNSFKIPIMFNYKFFEGKSKIKRRALFWGLGTYAEYFFYNTQHYKINNKHFKEIAPIQNKLNYGMQAELLIVTAPKSTTEFFSVIVGASYQASEYLRSQSSFKALQVYIRLGLGNTEDRSD